jgi:hypothetical protein
MLSKRSSTSMITLGASEQDLLRILVQRYRDSLDILSEPRHNELVRKCGVILKQLR